MKTLMISIVLLLTFNGCADKITNTEYIKQPKFKFYKIMDDTKGALAIDAGTKDIQKMCTPLVIESTDMVWMIVKYMEDQVDRYDEYVDANSTKEAK